MSNDSLGPLTRLEFAPAVFKRNGDLNVLSSATLVPLETLLKNNKNPVDEYRMQKKK